MSLTTEINDGVALVTLNRPEAMNALSHSLRAALSAAFPHLDADPAVRVIVLTGAGNRAFSAGLDLRELGQDVAVLTNLESENDGSNPVRAIAACGKPVIGAINGVAITGGFELALACDLMLLSENARFADTHAKVGVMPGWGLSQRLSRLVGPGRAKELAFSGRFLDAHEALTWGLGNRIVPPEALIPQALELARAMAAMPPAFLARYKRLIDDGYGLPFAEAMAMEARESQAWNSAATTDTIGAQGRRLLDRE